MRPSFRLVAVVTAAALVAGCGNSNRPAFSLDPRPVPPDEFMVQPQKPLEIPGDLSVLVPPDPNAVNRTTIDHDAVLRAALGGRPVASRAMTQGEALFLDRIGSADPAIRPLLRAEAAARRAAASERLERLAEDGAAALFYRRELLDPVVELARLRAMGVAVPDAPLQ